MNNEDPFQQGPGPSQPDSQASTPPPGEASPQGSSKDPASGGTREAFGQLWRAARQAFDAAADDVRKVSGETIPRARRGLESSVSRMAYSVGYLAGLDVGIMKHLSPELIRKEAANGFEEGIKATGKAAEAIRDCCRPGQKRSNQPETSGPEPGEADGQTSMA